MKGRQKQKPMSRMKKNEMLAGYLFLIPTLLCLLVWTIYPIAQALGYSLTEYNILSPPKFTGLENYMNLFSDSEWLFALKRTFLYVLIYVPSMYIISLGAAEMIKHLKKFSGFFRTAYFIPVVASAVAVGSIFKLVLNTKMGLVNRIFFMLGIDKINFLGDQGNALITCALITVWMGFGYNMLIFLNGLLDVPREYYESAQIDGANGFQQFRYITFPALGHTSVFVLSMGFINSFQAYDVLKLLTDGGPNYSTTLVIQRIYINAFQHYRMGYACAMTVVLFLIIFCVTMIQLKVTSKMADNGWGGN